MFRHTGKGRSYVHNLKLASLLSAVAGLVNISGILSLAVFTTNVTGHFANFSEELFLRDYNTALVYLYYILFFLLGAFCSSLIVELVAKFKRMYSYVIPITLEIVILVFVGFSETLIKDFSVLIACLLLFAMGLQNALVTRVSKSVVRTTHLTGLFTDLGIELAQLIFYREAEDKLKLRKAISLKLVIIGSFFTGGVVGGYLYLHFNIKTLFLAVLLLLIALWYDRLFVQYHYIIRKLSRKYNLFTRNVVNP